MYKKYGKGFSEETTKVQVFYLDIEPTAKGRPRFTKGGRTYTPKKTKEASSLISNHIKMTNKWDKLEKGEPVGVYIRFFCKRPKSLGKGDRLLKTTKPDLDNYIKLILDGMNESGIWHDDSQVVEILAQKWYCADYQEPQIQVQVNRL
jgi:Holliday junction resolvase RusA-like endonuclease